MQRATIIGLSVATGTLILTAGGYYWWRKRQGLPLLGELADLSATPDEIRQQMARLQQELVEAEQDEAHRGQVFKMGQSLLPQYVERVFRQQQTPFLQSELNKRMQDLCYESATINFNRKQISFQRDPYCTNPDADQPKQLKSKKTAVVKVSNADGSCPTNKSEAKQTFLKERVRKEFPKGSGNYYELSSDANGQLYLMRETPDGQRLALGQQRSTTGARETAWKDFYRKPLNAKNRVSGTVFWGLKAECGGTDGLDVLVNGHEYPDHYPFTSKEWQEEQKQYALSTEDSAWNKRVFDNCEKQCREKTEKLKKQNTTGHPVEFYYEECNERCINRSVLKGRRSIGDLGSPTNPLAYFFQ